MRLARPRLSAGKAIVGLWLLLLAAVLGVHYVHLTADFPNHSQWMDWAKYTDEGWYANAAIRHQQAGSWYMEGDFNPGIVLPVWPVLAGLLFAVTGVSLTALRALTVTVLLMDMALMYLLLRPRTRDSGRADGLADAGALWALGGVTVAATSAVLYCFSRIAILEPLVVFWFLLALLVARAAAGAANRSWQRGLSVALGLVLLLLILTKTNGVLLAPAIGWMLWPPNIGDGRRVWRFVGCAALALGTTATLWGLYYVALVRPHYAADYHYFFYANTWPRPIGLRGWLWNTWYTLHGVLWTGRLLPATAAGVLLLSVGPARRLWRDRLFGAAVLSVAAVLFFIWWHNNTQPRYYLVLVPGLIFIAVLGGRELFLSRRYRAAGMAAAAMLAIACVYGAVRIATFTAYPEYTYLQAAQKLTRYIDQHPAGRRLVLSISGDELRLMTGIPAICDDFGTEQLADRIERYQPGWYASWNDVDGGTLEDIHTRYRLVREISFPALDDSDRDQLILYRMMPLPGPDVGVEVDNTP